MIVPPDVTLTNPTAASIGAYIVVEQPLLASDGDGLGVTGFVRAGLSDGKTTPFKGGWQAGMLFEHLFAARPASSLSVGIGKGVLRIAIARPIRPVCRIC